MNKTVIKKKAFATRKQIGKLTYSNLISYIRKLGYELVYDSQNKLNVAAATDFKNHKIYVSTKISETIALQLLLHEIGHIVLEHSAIFNDTSEQEVEANYFAECCLKNLYRKPIVFSLILIALAIIFCSFLFIQNRSEMLLQSIDPVSINQYDETEILNDEKVLVTQSGKKYHKSNCQYVEHKTNTISLSLEEAKQAGYEPCKVCLK